jgi:hypothetical protein
MSMRLILASAMLSGVRFSGTASVGNQTPRALRRALMAVSALLFHVTLPRSNP